MNDSLERLRALLSVGESQGAPNMTDIYTLGTCR